MRTRTSLFSNYDIARTENCLTRPGHIAGICRNGCLSYKGQEVPAAPMATTGTASHCTVRTGEAGEDHPSENKGTLTTLDNRAI